MQVFASVYIAAQSCAFELILNNRNWFYIPILSLLYISLCIHLHFSSIFVGIGGLLQLGDVLVSLSIEPNMIKEELKIALKNCPNISDSI